MPELKGLSRKFPMWTMTDAREQVDLVQLPSRDYHYHVALGGGVLNNGNSWKDLDLYFLPLDSDDADPDIEGLFNFLKGVWGCPVSLIDPSYADTSWYGAKLKFTVGEKRIDVFIAGTPLPPQTLYEAQREFCESQEELVDDDIPF